jgi:hypothetical protein
MIQTLEITMSRVLMIGVWSMIGCVAVVGAPFLLQSDFQEKRVAVKTDWQKERIPKEAARDACVKMLHQVDRRHAAPPPFPDDICDFGSFADRRYELTVALEGGVISQDTWQRECLALKPASNQDCTYDPVGESIKAWKSAVARGITTKEAVQMDCVQLVKEKKGTESKNAKICEF